MIFAEMLKTARKSLGLTQKDVGDMMNVSAAYIGKLEKGGQAPSLEFLFKLCDCLEMDPLDAFFATLPDRKVPESFRILFDDLSREYRLWRDDPALKSIFYHLSRFTPERRNGILEIIGKMLDLMDQGQPDDI